MPFVFKWRYSEMHLSHYLAHLRSKMMFSDCLETKGQRQHFEFITHSRTLIFPIFWCVKKCVFCILGTCNKISTYPQSYSQVLVSKVKGIAADKYWVGGRVPLYDALSMHFILLNCLPGSLDDPCKPLSQMKSSFDSFDAEPSFAMCPLPPNLPVRMPTY